MNKIFFFFAASDRYKQIISGFFVAAIVLHLIVF